MEPPLESDPDATSCPGGVEPGAAVEALGDPVGARVAHSVLSAGMNGWAAISAEQLEASASWVGSAAGEQRATQAKG